ncbi:MAG: ABC transporter permease, partial [Clostridia bacterium]|nr:ABC transporter permease [Clostridia bacterium]
MSEKAVKKHQHEPRFHIAKRDDMIWWKAWLVRLTAIVIAMLLSGVLSVLLTGANFGEVFELMFRGTFGRLFEGKTSMLWRFLQQTAILLCLSLAVTPAFKMKFWNCGAEGQALIGGLVAMVCMMKLGGKVSDGLLVPIIIVLSIAAGAVWGLIPAIFKAYYKTNETLFTLMMNYVATQIVAYYVYLTGKGSGIIQPVPTGNLPVIGDQPYLLNILVVA